MSVAAAAAGGTPRPLVLAILVLISMVGSLSLNILMPVLPTLQTAFATTREKTTLVVSLFLVGMAVAQLLLGPLADRYGRRPVLLGGLALYVLASAAALFAQSIEHLFAARMAQSLGATAGLPLARTIIRDLYDRESSASMIGYVTMGMVIAPMVSPVLGAVAAEHWGWQSIFVICTALGGAAFLAVLLFMPETRPATRDAVTGREVAARSLALLGRPRFLGYAGTTACASATFFAFQASAPFLVIGVMGVGTTEYALWFVAGALAYMAGNFTSGRFSRRMGVPAMIALGNWGGLLGCALVLVCALVPVMHPAALFLPMALTAFFNGLVMPNAIAAAVSVDVRAVGAASGLAGFFQSALGAMASFGAGLIVTTTAVPLGIIVTAVAAGGIAFAHLAERG